jgi:hypothetical protein
MVVDIVRYYRIRVNGDVASGYFYTGRICIEVNELEQTTPMKTKAPAMNEN